MTLLVTWTAQRPERQRGITEEERQRRRPRGVERGKGHGDGEGGLQGPGAALSRAMQPPRWSLAVGPLCPVAQWVTL